MRNWWKKMELQYFVTFKLEHVKICLNPPFLGSPPPLLCHSPLFTEKFLPPPFRSWKKMGYPPLCKGGGAHYDRALSLLSLYQYLTSCQKLERSLEPFLRKTINNLAGT